MINYLHTSRVPKRMLAAFTSLTVLFNKHNDYKEDPTPSNLDALTQAAADFEIKIEMIRQTIAFSVAEIENPENGVNNQIEGESTENGIKLG